MAFNIEQTAAGLQKQIHRLAEGITNATHEEIKTTVSKPLPQIASAKTIDLYSTDAKEVTVFYDGICVKRQTSVRKDNTKGAIVPPDTPKRVNIDLAVLELPDGTFSTLTPGLSIKGEATYSTIDHLKHEIKQYYSTAEQAVPIVAITDGARNIRNFLTENISQDICIVLDWYHLQKKIKTLLPIAYKLAKKDKKAVITTATNLLWEGKTAATIEYLDTLSLANPLKREELMTYLTKHQEEIIDYKRRQAAGKTIGSGRGEKENDIIVARRQKHKGMAWTDGGSLSLAILAAA